MTNTAMSATSSRMPSMPANASERSAEKPAGPVTWTSADGGRGFGRLVRGHIGGGRGREDLADRGSDGFDVVGGGRRVRPGG
jgi:hypothetical protein